MARSYVLVVKISIWLEYAALPQFRQEIIAALPQFIDRKLCELSFRWMFDKATQGARFQGRCCSLSFPKFALFRKKYPVTVGASESGVSSNFSCLP